MELGGGREETVELEVAREETAELGGGREETVELEGAREETAELGGCSCLLPARVPDTGAGVRQEHKTRPQFTSPADMQLGARSFAGSLTLHHWASTGYTVLSATAAVA